MCVTECLYSTATPRQRLHVLQASRQASPAASPFVQGRSLPAVTTQRGAEIKTYGTTTTTLQPSTTIQLVSAGSSCCFCYFAVSHSNAILNLVLKVQRLQLLLAEASVFITEHDELLIVAASTLLCSFSHAALRPVLPVFVKVEVKSDSI